MLIGLAVEPCFSWEVVVQAIESEFSTVDRAWRAIQTNALIGNEQAVADDVSYAEKIGLPSKRAWSLILKGETDPGTEVSLDRNVIGFNAGYPAEVDWNDLPGRQQASVWSLESKADIEAALFDIVRDGFDPGRIARMSETMVDMLKDPGSVMIAARDVDSRHATGLMVFSRDVFVEGGEVTYNVTPKFVHGDVGGTPRSAMMACFQLQARADLETIMLSMAKAGDIRPISSDVSETQPAMKCLATEMSDLVDFAKENVFDLEDLPQAFDVGSIRKDPGSAFTI